VEVFGNGNLDISPHLAPSQESPGLDVGSVEGDGNVFLGANNLIVGSNKMNTTFSGVIQDGGINGGSSGSLTKIGTGTLDYTVGAESVSKVIDRQPLKLENNDGSYRFTHTWSTSGAGCTASDAFAPATGAVTGDMSITHVDADTAAISLQWKLAPVEFCSMSASYSQIGRFGQYQGTLNCPARTGTLTFFEVANRVKGLSGRYTVDWGYNCRYQGRFGGVSNSP